MRDSFLNDFWIYSKKCIFASASKGGLAQLARAFDWQSKGHRFDSDILHIERLIRKG